MDANPTKYLGKYRASVVNNVDPMKKGRIQVQVADVNGLTPSSWAMPCVPVAGLQTGFYSVPPIGAGVWVEFEQGDPDYPIWVGGYWGEVAEVPTLANLIPPRCSASRCRRRCRTACLSATCQDRLAAS